ncbi:hypothetical protein R1flu_017288 [Riccia fluitans]|uniref:Uncharacterized protein n=1 Tax=Riccia fluitans TaxID=41844 RepID=A0ABD1XDM1_9MARC
MTGEANAIKLRTVLIRKRVPVPVDRSLSQIHGYDGYSGTLTRFRTPGDCLLFSPSRRCEKNRRRRFNDRNSRWKPQHFSELTLSLAVKRNINSLIFQSYCSVETSCCLDSPEVRGSRPTGDSDFPDALPSNEIVIGGHMCENANGRGGGFLLSGHVYDGRDPT